MNRIAAIGLIAGFASSLQAQTLNLHGKVTNTAGQPVANAEVLLKHQGKKATTGTDGSYTLTGTVGLASHGPSAQGLSMDQGVLRIAVSGAAKLKVEVFDLQGNLLRMEAVPNATAGLYRWDFATHSLSDQMLLIKASVGRETRTFRYMPMGEAAGEIPTTGFTPAAAFLAKAAADLDTLQVTATGYTVKKAAVTAWDATMDVSLSEQSSSGDRSAGCGKTSTLKSGKALSFTPPGGGGARTYNLRIPDDYNNATAYRLIVGIHWLNGTANNVSDGGGATSKPYYGLWELANPTGGKGTTIFVAPQGNGNSWPSGQVPFITSLVDMLKSEFCIDNKRVFAEGFSMGGSMSYALACEAPEVFRAVAVHSGGPMSGCVKKNKPVAYFMTHGTQDQTCTYPGYGVPQVNEFAKLNGCQAMDIPGTLKPTNSNGTDPACADFQGCTEGYPTRACIFVGPHTPSPGGNANWVPGETWKFISKF
jgi:hypothetical protein